MGVLEVLDFQGICEALSKEASNRGVLDLRTLEIFFSELRKKARS